MSAHCNHCGADIVYPEGTWPLGECPVCTRDEHIETLERRIAEQRKEIRHLRERLNDEGEGKTKANKHARRRIARLERIIGQQAVALDRQYHGLRALKDDVA